MIDFTKTTILEKNVDFEKIISENHSLRKNNDAIVIIAISVIVLIACLSIYMMNKQDKDQNKHTMTLN
jgi:hypothetical protein|nr:hypothetical protein [uncultured Flavobacterium sp.]